MSGYDLLVFLHVSAAIIWLGAGFVLAVLVFGAERAGERGRESSYHRDVGWLAPRLFIPASVSTLLLGILLVVDEEAWSFDQLWIAIGLAGWLVSFALGFFYFRPEGERIGELAARHGPDHPDLKRRIHRVNIIDRLQLVVLFLMVADMVIKPTGDDSGTLVAGAAVLAAATLWAATAVRRGAPTGPPRPAGAA